MDAVEALAIILSVVSLIITAVGYIASQRFYQSGVELQGKATETLNSIQSQTASIERQITSLFERTLEFSFEISRRESGSSPAIDPHFAKRYAQLKNGFSELPSDQKTVLSYVAMRRRPLTAAEVAEAIDKGVDETYENLESLENSGFVLHHDGRDGTGFMLTPEAHVAYANT